MSIDWKEIENTLGNKIVYASVAGSRRSNLQTNRSDHDYAVYTWPKNNTAEQFVVKDKEGRDFFIRNLNPYRKLGVCAGFWPSLMYDSVIYTMDDSVKEFFKENSYRLSNMSPYHFYKSGIILVESFCSKPNLKRLAIGLREAGIIRNFMKTGDVTQSCYLDGEYLDLYQKLKTYDPSVSGYDVHKKLNFLYEDSTLLFFKEFQPDYEIFYQFQNKLKEWEEKIND